MIRKTLLVALLSMTAPTFAASEGEIGKLLDQRLNSENAAQAEAEQAAIAKGKRVAVLTEGNAVLKDLDALQATIDRWEAQMKAILTSPEGQALASDPVSIEDFMNLQAAKRMTLAQVDALRAQVQTVLAPVQAAAANSLYTPSPVLVAEIQNSSGAVKKAQADYDALQAKWRVLTQRTKGGAAGGPTLAAVIEKVKDEEAAREMHAGQLARAQSDQARAAAAAEQRQRIEEEKARQDALDQQQQLELEKQRRAHDRLVKEAQNPVLVQRYAPFLGQAHHALKRPDSSRMVTDGGKPDVNGYWPRIRDDIPAPLSYSALSAWGALTNVRMFVFIALSKHNERPKGDFREPASQADWDRMTRFQEEFNRYAPVWVELGMLKP